MNRAQAGHEDEAAQIDAGEENEGADAAHPGQEQFLPEGIANPAARALNIKGETPTLQISRLQLKQTGSRNDEEHDPTEARQHPQFGVEQLGAAESEQNRGQ